ncbi:hypothetical protein SAMN06295964_0039 [Aeromicrobium choanae]|uniref:SnoaL-like domain-containing protein n=2 Tax=Aeromicrobium choanae TaxID=1736691 RepID=A0A1T4YLS7_9ACTN|nr:hypothetical protein SAMN06295964_0039 [Aeromicrobium choanae]
MRVTTCALALSGALLLGGCGGDDGSDTPATTAPSPTASAQDEAVAVLEAYWSERVRVETSGAYDTADFSRILSPAESEPMQARYAQFEDGNFRRVGAPELRDYTATVDGDTAIATVCVNEDEWGAEADGEVVEPEAAGWYASSHRLEQTDGAWLIAGSAETPSGISC